MSENPIPEYKTQRFWIGILGVIGAVVLYALDKEDAAIIVLGSTAVVYGGSVAVASSKKKKGTQE